MPDFVTPPPAQPGDRVAIVAPASGLAETYPAPYERGLERLSSVFDLEPVEFPTATKSNEYLYEHPEERAADVEAAFADPDISAVIATIGGNDQVRILDHLDGDVLRSNPTRFFGTSDNTNIAQFLWREGIVSFYGGNVLTEFGLFGPFPEYLESSLRTALFEDSFGPLEPAPTFTDQDLDWAEPENMERQPEMQDNPGWLWRGGDQAVTGRLWGGCLEILSLQLAVDRFLPSAETLEGSILLVETSEELPAAPEVRRMLLGFGERGLLERFDGVLVGRVKARSHAVERSPEEREAYRERVREAIVDVVTEYNPTAPIVCNVDVGHTNPIVPLPIGGLASIDPAKGTIAVDI